MGTSAFDKLWGSDPKPAPPATFDAVWENTPPDPLAKYHDAYKAGTLGKDNGMLYQKDMAETGAEHASGAGASLLQGATLGAGNKITAGLRTILPEVLGGVKGFDFKTALDEQTKQLEDYRQRHPFEATALELAGSIPSVALTGGMGEGAAVGRMARLGQLAKGGAIYGGASGGLSANTLGDVLPGAAKGAALGAAVAPVAGAVLGGASRLAGRMLPNKVGQMVGNAPRDIAGKADRSLLGTLRSGGVNPGDVAGDIGAGEPTTIMDLGSRQVGGLARAARNVPNSNAAQNIDQMLTKRSVETGPRIQDALSKTSDIPREDFTATMDDLAKQMKVRADPLYEQARAHPGIPATAQAVNKDTGEIGGPALADLLKRPSMQKAVTYHNALAAEQPELYSTLELPKMGQGPSVPGLGPVSPEVMAKIKAANPGIKIDAADELVPMETLHNMKLRLDEMLGYAKHSGSLPDGTPATGKTLRAIQETRGQLLSILDAENPAYQLARSTYAGDASVRDAFKDGQKFFHSTTPAVEGAAELSSLSPSEQEMWRRGGMTWLQQKIKNVSANPDLPDASRKVNVIQRVLGGSEDADKAKLLFKTPEEYAAFIKQMGPEAIYPKTNTYLTGQSSTAAQLAEERAGGKSTAFRDLYYLGRAAHGSSLGGAHIAGRIQEMLGGKGAMSPEMANAISERVTKQGSTLAEYLKQLDALPDLAARKSALTSLLGNASAVTSTTR